MILPTFINWNSTVRKTSVFSPHLSIYLITFYIKSTCEYLRSSKSYTLLLSLFIFVVQIVPGLPVGSQSLQVVPCDMFGSLRFTSVPAAGACLTRTCCGQACVPLVGGGAISALCPQPWQLLEGLSY